MGKELADQENTGNQPSWGVIWGDSGGAALGLPPAPRPQLAEEMPLVLVREAATGSQNTVGAASGRPSPCPSSHLQWLWSL